MLEPCSKQQYNELLIARCKENNKNYLKFKEICLDEERKRFVGEGDKRTLNSTINIVILSAVFVAVTLINSLLLYKIMGLFVVPEAVTY